jgi:GNAT superfamily N-acetyltransferase
MTVMAGTPLRLRAAQPNDISSMALLHLDAVVTAYAGLFPPDAPHPTLGQLRGEWEHALAEDGATAIVAEVEATIVGTVVIRPDPDFPACGQLRRLHVAPSRWGEGIGSQLHDEALRCIHQDGYPVAGLWVLRGNYRARGIYERRGWSLVAEATLEPDAPGVVEVRYCRNL